MLCNFVLELGLELQFLFFQMIAHLLRCHLCMEPFAVTSWRQLPSLHPVWKLLKPHIVGIIAINTLGRERLISPGGLADRLLSIGGGGLFVHSSIHPFTHLFALLFVHSFNHFIISYRLVVCNDVFFKNNIVERQKLIQSESFLHRVINYSCKIKLNKIHNVVHKNKSYIGYEGVLELNSNHGKQIFFPLPWRGIYPPFLFRYYIFPLPESLRLSDIEVKISVI